MGNNRNMIVAIALSLVVMLGWQYFVAGPQLEKARLIEAARQEQIAQSQAQSQPAANGATVAGTPAAGAAAGSPVVAVTTAATREAALAAAPRVPIDTPEIAGSVNLRGGRIDDVALKAYRTTVDPASPMVTLLNPLGGPDAYYADFSYAAPGGDTTPLPNADTLWTAPPNAALTPASPLVITWDNGAGLLFTRTIKVDDHAMFTVSDTVANTGTASATLYPYGAVVRYGTPVTQGTYILHEGLLGVFGVDGSLTEVDYSTLAEEGSQKVDAVTAGWLGITDKYWAAALIPAGGTAFRPGFLHQMAGPIDTYRAEFVRDPLIIAPGASAATEVNLFAGAKVTTQIEIYGAALSIPKFDLMIDWGWFYFLTKPMFYLIDFLYRMVGNFGVAILLVTVIIKGLFYPLANKSYASMSKMKKVQPEIVDLRERFKDDKMKQQQAMMELYKREKINPVAGCLPILVQIPVFFALYKVLYVTIEMRHAPFFGWIHDLSAPDPTSLFNLFGLLPYDVPHFLLIGVWPLIMGVTMFVQMKLNPTPPDPTQAMIFTWMPVLFTFMLASFPAGLVIYWAWNNSLSILQQSVIMHRQGVKIELWDNIRSTFTRKKPTATS